MLVFRRTFEGMMGVASLCCFNHALESLCSKASNQTNIFINNIVPASCHAMYAWRITAISNVHRVLNLETIGPQACIMSFNKLLALGRVIRAVQKDTLVPGIPGFRASAARS